MKKDLCNHIFTVGTIACITNKYGYPNKNTFKGLTVGQTYLVTDIQPTAITVLNDDMKLVTYGKQYFGMISLSPSVNHNKTYEVW